MTSTLPTHPSLVWARTDGDKSRWPALNSGNNSTMVPLEENHKKYAAYEEAAGEHLAEVLGLPKLPGKQKHRICMPPGYRLFTHKQPRPDGQLREDQYCFGSSNVGRIRSAVQWKEHAAWLFDVSKPLDKHHADCLCGGSKSSNKKAGSASGTPSSGPLKRSAPTVVKRAHPPKRPRFSPEPADDEDAPTGCNPDRASDLGSQRRFRRGELVWFRINAIEPPTPNLPALTHWPCLIAEIRHKSREHPAQNASGALSFVNGGLVHHYWEYHLRPLGLFDSKSDVVRDIKDLLPWNVGFDLLGGDKGRASLAAEGARYLTEGIDREVQEDTEADASTRWRAKWGSRKRFESVIDRKDNWAEAAFRLVVAIRTGTVISQSWCQTDRIDAISESILSLADRDALNSNQKSLYQGLWVGGERIWAEDVVRIKLRRDKLPPGLAPIGHGTGVTDRAVFLRIQAIALEMYVPKEADPKTETWRCLVYGDLAELIPAPPGAEGAADSGWAAFGPTSGIAQPLVQNYKAPAGFVYRQINTDDSQITCDIGDIAGRVYPDLLEESTQTWYGKQPPRAPAGRRAIALMGLSPGSEAATECSVWSEDLFVIVDKASRNVENSFSSYYTKELQTRMKRDPAKKPAGWKAPGKPVSSKAPTSAGAADPVSVTAKGGSTASVPATASAATPAPASAAATTEANASGSASNLPPASAPGP